ncbi:MAG: YlmH/Sll1252 family protein [Clostridia bacterium]|nr:YlmH/Sll1252 family protein [Clostridia bacterium]
MNEKDVLMGQIQDKYSRFRGKNVLTATDFLDLNQQSIANGHTQEGIFYGGYEDAERKRLVFLPDYANLEDTIKVLKVTRAKEGRELTHRDYLGSLLAEGIKREKIGDILVRDDGADILVAAEVAEYLASNYSMAGRVSLKVEIGEVEDLDLSSQKTKEIKDTVSALRLDSVLSSAFGISRSKAQEAVKMGIVFLNGVQMNKSDKQVKEGDKLVIRGKGKACLREVSGKSKKDRIYIIVDRYI